MATQNHAPTKTTGDTTFRREVWQSFQSDQGLRARHKITEQEMEALSHLAMLGSILSKQDFIFILKTIRKAPRR
ncbi:MAG: hypothetical protein WAU33_12440 [Candidatus Binataceae bacterium]|jgi:hypothetical protein